MHNSFRQKASVTNKEKPIKQAVPAPKSRTEYDIHLISRTSKPKFPTKKYYSGEKINETTDL